LPGWPVSGKSRINEHDRSVWNFTVRSFPSFEILDTDEVIPIARTLDSHVDSDAGPNQLFNRYLIQGLSIPGEMNGRIDMGAAMFGHFQSIRSVVVPTRRVPCLLENEPEVLLSRPDDRVCLEGMGEIDKPWLLSNKMIKPRLLSGTCRSSKQAQ
jgi:hypothetical protein